MADPDGVEVPPLAALLRHPVNGRAAHVEQESPARRLDPMRRSGAPRVRHGRARAEYGQPHRHPQTFRGTREDYQNSSGTASVRGRAAPHGKEELTWVDRIYRIGDEGFEV